MFGWTKKISYGKWLSINSFNFVCCVSFDRMRENGGFVYLEGKFPPLKNEVRFIFLSSGLNQTEKSEENSFHFPPNQTHTHANI